METLLLVALALLGVAAALNLALAAVSLRCNFETEKRLGRIEGQFMRDGYRPRDTSTTIFPSAAAARGNGPLAK